MKELYTSPEVKLVAFAANEKLAALKLDLDFNDFFGGVSLEGAGNATEDSKTDAKLPM